MRCCSFRSGKSARRGFVLLEVILSIVILGLAMAAVLRSFTLSLSAARKAQVVTKACFLAEQILEEYEVIPPQGDHAEGDFSEGIEEDYSSEDEAGTEMYRNYYWTMDAEEVEVDYEDISFERDREEFEALTKVTVTIIYDNNRQKRFTPVRIETYLSNADKFTYMSRKENHIY